MEISLNLISIISLLAFGIGSFFACYLLFSKLIRSISNILLFGILLILLIELFYDFLIYSHLIYKWTFLFGLSGFGGLILYPLLFFYTFSLAKKKWKWWYLAAFIPFLIGFGNKAIRYLSIQGQQKIDMLDAFYRHTRPGPTDYFSNSLLLWAKVILPALFIMASLYQLWDLRRKNQNKLPVFVWSLSAVMLLALIYVLFVNFLNKTLYQSSSENYIEWMVNLALISGILIMLVSMMLKQLEEGETIFDGKKYRDSGLKKDKSQYYYQSSSKLIKAEQLYLDPDFTLSTLAKKMSVNSKYLSQAINENLGMSFSRYINQLRVEQAQQLLVDENFKHFTIEGIAKEVGFRSKSAFYKAFREITGLSPKDFQSRSDS